MKKELIIVVYKQSLSYENDYDCIKNNMECARREHQWLLG